MMSLRIMQRLKLYLDDFLIDASNEKRLLALTKSKVLGSLSAFIYPP